ncbi:protoporphyrinogen oxidase HemJ [Candidatus Liberibacter americanus]|uniref:Protoporphyrinogen IX oxidase n=1 Tax=Candidatus Liberibacter americanus str. Sao Paulo TaxID=1261131 RepID=U6B4G1_9HYPH|nr:protoporphyrinogen oxidase HemJ [Candidatus Liberibacter americanus]AHA27518.1 putative membrane protein [Candidatus Liberibacter americanus str. Sao Paulo]EMS36520.1 hypothetical protein G653_01142 [Candidatus Liberibacter americanus PW_SP]
MKFIVSDQDGKKAQSIAYISLLVFLITFVGFFFFFSSDFFLCIKSIHIISVISWMAGLLYMPRLFVYHSLISPEIDQYKTFEIMEERLLKVIMNPAMILSWLCGFYMIWVTRYSQIGWFRIKFFFVIILSAYHFYLVFLIREFKRHSSRHNCGYFKAINEIPTIIMITVVFLSVLKPF